MVTICMGEVEMSKIIAGQKSGFDDEVTCAQRGIVGFISQARHLANTLASLGYNKAFAAGRQYLWVIN